MRVIWYTGNIISAVIQMIHRLFRLICPIKIIFAATLLIAETSQGRKIDAAKNKDRKIMERDKIRATGKRDGSHRSGF